jgi:hypothetical protein
MRISIGVFESRPSLDDEKSVVVIEIELLEICPPIK